LTILQPLPQGRVQPLANTTGKLEELSVTIKFNRLARGIQHNLAAVAGSQMLFENLF
jgi:hypothetical protein